jgi:hypothetical protein
MLSAVSAALSGGAGCVGVNVWHKSDTSGSDSACRAGYECMQGHARMFVHHRRCAHPSCSRLRRVTCTVVRDTAMPQQRARKLEERLSIQHKSWDSHGITH